VILPHRITRFESVTSGRPPPPAPRHVTPRVTIGIPTFNRAGRLTSAVASCRAQTYPNLEILISDNASSDETADLCDDWSRVDHRVTVIRQLHNIGRERNFGAVLRAASGELFMWLSDDDWIESDYVAACVARLVADSDCVIAGGTVTYFRPGAMSFRDSPAALTSADAGTRILNYFATVGLNGSYYGLMRREDVFRAEYPITLSGDWYFVAQMAALGTIALLPEVGLHRSAAGDSSDMMELAASYGVATWWGRDIHLWVLFAVAPGLVRGHGAFGLIPRRRRCEVAVTLCSVLFRRWWHHNGRKRLGVHAAGRVRRRAREAGARHAGPSRQQ
jgi:glycosyltransferase involved in cell wall biosynthesis